MNQTVILGGQNINWASYDFQGGKITSICGAIEVDLTECYLSQENRVIEVKVFCGAALLKISRDWNVRVEIVPVLGTIEDDIFKQPQTHIDPAALLILKGSVVMGNLEIQRV